RAGKTGDLDSKVKKGDRSHIMAQKLFVVIVVFLVVGALIGQSSAEDGVVLSELSNAPAEALEDVAHEGHLRVKRGWGRRWKRFRKK
ncbi:hypothetical protein DKP78_21215, partial [Enterococcus faecium]